MRKWVAAAPDIVKTVTPASAAPGEAITYTLDFGNAGVLTATDVVITDSIPVSVTGASVINSGVVITQQGGTNYAWQVADLAQGEGGVITITGVLSDPLPVGVFTNTATITTTVSDSNPGNNEDNSGVTVESGVTSSYVITLTNLKKGAVTSSYVVTNTGASMATSVHDFYDASDTHVTQEFFMISPLGSITVDLVTVTGLSNGYTGYVVVSADQSILGQVFTPTVNNPPQFTSSPVMTATQDVLYTYTITATDPDVGDVLTITAPTRPTWLALTDNGDGTADLSGTPGATKVGTHTVSLQVEDSAGLTDTQDFIVTVSPAAVNNPPSFSSSPVTTATENAAYIYDVITTDPDVGDVLTITAPTLPGWLGLNDNGDGTADLSGTPGGADVGEHPVTLRVVDNGGLVDTQTFSITVSAIATSTNTTPTISDVADQATPPSTPFSVTFSISDTETPVSELWVYAESSNLALVNGGLTGTLMTGGGMSVDCADTLCALWITPTVDATGTTTITVTVDDGELSASDDFLLTVEIEDYNIYLPLVVRNEGS